MEATRVRTCVPFLFAATVLSSTTIHFTRADDADDPKIRKSVVKIFTKARQPDPFRPWTSGAGHDATGSGVVIVGKRILTNAHVVNHASQLLIQPDKSSEKLAAKVEALAPGIDLAVLKLDDESFFDAHPPLPFNAKAPALQQTTFVYGYPEGGSELSITRGIVSRVEFAEYYLLNQGLRIQVDAAINPGNSGGPAVANGQLIGIAFSKLQSSDNIGYIIPMEEIDLFLADIKDGRYDGKPVLKVDTQNLENDALRARFQRDKKDGGVLVRRILYRDPSCPLKVGDIITKLGEHMIARAGMVQVEGDRMLNFKYLVQRLARDGRLALTVSRAGKDATIELPVGPVDCMLFRSLSQTPSSYFVFGPLVLTEASGDYLRSLTAYGASKGEGASAGAAFLSLLYTANPLFTRYGDKAAFPDERIVIVGHPLFSHRIGKGYEVSYAAAVAAVNSIPIRNLKHLVEIIRDATGEYIEFTFHGNDTDMIVFKRSEAIAATEEILNDNSIRHQCSADIAPVWNPKK
jgi:S1-C subfamily serine protease